MEAALGALYNNASSPKASPGVYCLRTVSSLFPGKSLVQVRVPDSTTNRLSPSSPY